MSTKTKSASRISSDLDEFSGLITGCTILTPLRRIEGRGILFRDCVITGFTDSSEPPGDVPHHSFEDCIAVPGFIDIHMHGAMGINFLKGSADSICTALEVHLRNGTTSCLPTLMTAPRDKTERAIAGILRAGGSSRQIPEILGINLEGPFISADRRGAHDRDSIRTFEMEDFEELERLRELSQDKIRIMTIAPELEGARLFTTYLSNHGVNVSAGHTNASYDETMAAVSSGVRLATHLFNAMRGIMQREPGALGALLLSDEVYAELIADGEHVHPALFRLITRVKGPEKIILITDASPEYGLKEGASRNETGTLVGGTMPLPGELKVLMRNSDLDLRSALRTMTLNPAKFLGLERWIGVLKKGADADIVILSRNLDVKAVFSKGRRVV